MAKNAAAPALDPIDHLAEIDAELDRIIAEQKANESADILPGRKCEMLGSEFDQMKTDVDKRIASYIRAASDERFKPLRSIVTRNDSEWREFLLVANRVACEKYLQGLISEHTPSTAIGDKERNQIAAKLGAARRELETEREALCTKYNYERRRDCLIEVVIAWTPPKKFDVMKLREIKRESDTAADQHRRLDDRQRDCLFAISKAKSRKEQAQGLRDSDTVKQAESEISEYQARLKEIEQERIDVTKIRSSRDKVLQNARTFLHDHGIELDDL